MDPAQSSSPITAIIDRAQPSTDQLWELLRNANQGDRGALARLQIALNGPNGDELVQFCGDLVQQAERSLLESTVINAPGTQRVIRETLLRMRTDLGWEASPRLEQLLIERVVLTWLQLHLAELAQAQSTSQHRPSSRYMDERIDRLHRRHLSAIKSLSTVRRLSPMGSANLVVAGR